VTFNPENGLLLVRGTTNDLRLIEQAIQKVQPAAVPSQTNSAPKSVPTPNSYYRTNTVPVHISKGAERINAKLDELILPEVRFDAVPLPEVVKWLDANVKQLDPEKKGLNFLINNVVSDFISPDVGSRRAAPLLDPQGNPIPATPRPALARPDLAGVLVKLPVAVPNLTLRQALDAICKASAVKLPDGRSVVLKFTVEEYAIVFSPKLPEQAELFSRIFKVDPETFVRGLRSVTAGPIIAARTEQFRKAGGTNLTVELAELNVRMRDYLRSVGVSNLGPTNGPVGTQIYLNDQKGLLLVRASLEDLDIIQQAIELLNANKPHVSIEAKLLRVTADDTGKTIGFDWFLGNTQLTRPAAPVTNHFVHVDREGNFLLDGRLRSLDQLEAELRAVVRTNPTVRVRISAAPEADYGDAVKVFERTSRMGLTNAYFTRETIAPPAAPPVAPIAKANVEPRRATFTGILSEPQMQVVWKAVTQRTNMSTLNLPAVRTVAGKPATMTPAAGGAGADWAQGLKLDVLPSAEADGYTLRVKITVTRDGKKVVESDCVVWDGQTVMIGNLEPAPATDPAGKKSPHTVLFLTPTLVDPAGNRVHNDAGKPTGPAIFSLPVPIPQPQR